MNLNHLELILPFPPSINHYYIATTRGRCLKPEVLAYKQEVLYRFKKEVSVRFGDKPISLSILIYPPDKRRRDGDNLIKMLFDILQELGVYNDDSQIVYYTVEKRSVFIGGKAEVIIREYDVGVKDKKYSYYYYCIDG